MRHLSTQAYEYLRSEELLKLPCRTTLQKCFGSTSGEVGFSQLVRSRLEAELETLDTPQSKVCSLVVDEMRIKQKLVYNKQRDAFVGDVDLGPELDHLAPASDGENLANSLLLIAALKYLRDQAGHSCDIEFASVRPTVEFMEVIHIWFTCVDVSNLQQHIHRNDEDACQFSDTDDRRLEWLEGKFLFYIEQLKTKSRAENYLTAQVAMELVDSESEEEEFDDVVAMLAEHGRGGVPPGFNGRVLQLSGTLRLTGVRPLDYQQDDASTALMEVVQGMEAAATSSTSDTMEKCIAFNLVHQLQVHMSRRQLQPPKLHHQVLESISSSMRRLALAAEESTALLRQSAEAVERAPSAQEAFLRES
ncbi:hypothetical protein MTO96_035860 [Rhipicephalus appendiculatus]